MMADLALLAWPPQVLLSVEQSAEQPEQSADVCAAHSSKHCKPEHLLRPDEHVRGPPHAHTWPVRAVLGSLLWPSCVLFRTQVVFTKNIMVLTLSRPVCTAYTNACSQHALCQYVLQQRGCFDVTHVFVCEPFCFIFVTHMSSNFWSTIASPL